MSYYDKKLAGARLRECYEVASPRVRQYLRAEVEHVLRRIDPGDTVLELGCGYGRVVFELATVAARVVGIDSAAESIELARQLARQPTGQSAGDHQRYEFFEMNAIDLKFPDGEFDVVVCIQNGICAFRVDQLRLLRETLRVTRPGGRVLLSSYAKRFWPHRLEWFQRQAARGLVGEIDLEATRDNVIVCKDGFRSGALNEAQFAALCTRVGDDAQAGIAVQVVEIREIDASSLFCECTRVQ